MKTPVLVSTFNKFVRLRPANYWKETLATVLHFLYESFKNTFFTEQLWMTASDACVGILLIILNLSI